jgi:hypothetical protein
MPSLLKYILSRENGLRSNIILLHIALCIMTYSPAGEFPCRSLEALEGGGAARGAPGASERAVGHTV